jgi:hypothetical protein
MCLNIDVLCTVSPWLIAGSRVAHFSRTANKNQNRIGLVNGAEV